MFFQQAKNLSNNYLNLLFTLIPASFIAGNLILNLNLVIFIISTLVLHWEKILKLDLDILDKLIIIFFLFCVFTGIFNTVEKYFYMKSINISPVYDYTVLFKTFFYLRYLVFYFCVRYLDRVQFLCL